jgi:putative peptidoglycan lipid II flippase
VLPVTIITFFTRGYLVNFIKNGGDALMAGLLGALVLAILFRSIYHIAARSFYAQQDTKTPMYISLFTIALNITLAVWFALALNMGAYGLAWAQSLVAGIEVAILFFIMARRTEGLFDKVFVHAVARMVSATGFMSVVSYTTVQLFQLQNVDQSFLATFPKFCVIAGVSMASYVAFCYMLKISEATPVVSRAMAILFGRLGRK